MVGGWRKKRCVRSQNPLSPYSPRSRELGKKGADYKQRARFPAKASMSRNLTGPFSLSSHRSSLTEANPCHSKENKQGATAFLHLHSLWEGNPLLCLGAGLRGWSSEASSPLKPVPAVLHPGAHSHTHSSLFIPRRRS